METNLGIHLVTHCISAYIQYIVLKQSLSTKRGYVEPSTLAFMCVIFLFSSMRICTVF